jgi:membrane protein DedA with SNARE-associated domain
VSLTEYIILFVLAASTGAGVPGPGDGAVIAAGTLAGEGRLNVRLPGVKAGWLRWRATRRTREGEMV